MPIIEVKNLQKTFSYNDKSTSKNLFKSNIDNKIIVLNDVSFTVYKGEILGVIGFNGSGKTTLLRLIAGIYKPNSGSIKVQGKIAPLLQLGTGFNDEMTAQDNIIMYGMLLGLKKDEITSKIESILEYADLQDFKKMRLKHYSTGMRSKLAFSTAIQIDFDILLLDEILSVGDQKFRQKSYEKFLSFKENNKTILYATHNLANLSKFCDRILLIHKGKKIMIDVPDKVLERYREITRTSN